MTTFKIKNNEGKLSPISHKTTKPYYVSIEIYEQFLQESNEMAEKLQEKTKSKNDAIYEPTND